MLPIRIINSGAACALEHLTSQGLSVPTWIEAFAFDLNAARDVFTAHVRREVRPQVEALAKNRHFFAAEAIEAIFMQLFLLDSPGGGCGPPRGMSRTGRGGPARVRGDVKLVV